MAYYDECIGGNHGLANENDLTQKLDSLRVGNDMIALAIFTAGVSCNALDDMFHRPANAAEGDLFDIEHLLEIRVFSESAELHALRGSMGKPFSWRFIRDDKTRDDYDDSTHDESHYLDIDANQTNGTPYKTTTGGKYYLPKENLRKIRIRNYIDYDDEGMARIVDFRIVALEEEGE